jgi:hypothetical protein
MATSKKYPVLKDRTHSEGDKHTTVIYGLRGTSTSSCFSVTADQYIGRQHETGGFIPEEVLRIWPDLAPLVALHLSDRDGIPMHAESNGWYWLAGALGGAGEKYHGGNGSTARTPEECLEIFAKHCRITVEEAVRIAAAVRCADEPRKRWASICAGMRDRWQQEADAAVKKFKLEQ